DRFVDRADLDLAGVHREAARAPSLRHLSVELDENALGRQPREALVDLALRRLGLDAVLHGLAAGDLFLACLLALRLGPADAEIELRLDERGLPIALLLRIEHEHRRRLMIDNDDLLALADLVVEPLALGRVGDAVRKGFAATVGE